MPSDVIFDGDIACLRRPGGISKFINLYFYYPPDDKTREILKISGWRYYGKEKYWSIKYTEDNEKSGILFCGSKKNPTTVASPDKIIDFNDLLVINSIKKCIHKDHNLEKKHVAVYTMKYGTMVSRTIPVFYCEECDVHYIMEAEYKALKEYGYICCRIMSYSQYEKLVLCGFDWAPQSLMAAYGYTVSRAVGLSDSERHQILDFLNANGIISYIEQYDFIHWLVKQNMLRSEMAHAVEKWNSDREYLSEKFTK